MLRYVIHALMWTMYMESNPISYIFVVVISYNTLTWNNNSIILDLLVIIALICFCITDTWLLINDYPIFAALNTPPLQFTYLLSNSSNLGGGIEIRIKSFLHLSTIINLKSSASQPVRPSNARLVHWFQNVFLFYLPHVSNQSEFINKLQLFAFQWNPNSIIIGDFNYTSSQPFPNLISNCNLKRHIKSPIHDKGTIDLLITPKSCYITKPLSIGSLFPTVMQPYSTHITPSQLVLRP